MYPEPRPEQWQSWGVAGVPRDARYVQLLGIEVEGKPGILKKAILFFFSFIFISWRLIIYNIVVVFAIH